MIAAGAADVERYCGETVRLLAGRQVRVDLVVAAGGEDRLELFTDVTVLGHRTLALPAEAELRGELVRQIRRLQPEVVLTVDPTPMLRQHPDHRAVARAALDAAWPYAGADADPELGEPHSPKEAWLYSGPAPDLFVGGEKFAQVDLRDRAATSPSG